MVRLIGPENRILETKQTYPKDSELESMARHDTYKLMCPLRNMMDPGQAPLRSNQPEKILRDT